MLEILPVEIIKRINGLDYNKLFEIRIRADKPVMINYGGIFYYLGDGLCKTMPLKPVIISKELIVSIIAKSSSYSVYAYNEQIKHGYITLKGGFRIGISGDVVVESKDVITIKDIYSLNLRIPHEVFKCSEKIIPYIVENKRVLNSLIIAPPGMGKTTILRDLTVQINGHIENLNILIVDEKNEISAMSSGENLLKIGQNCDVYSNCSKDYGINIGIRTMRPDVIITDELNSDNDLECISYAATCGVSIISSIHSSSLQGFLNKSNTREITGRKIFDRYIVLSGSNGVGTLENVYDVDLNPIFSRNQL